ncbi:aminopeptidase N [Glaciecola siphonariae]|uniref:Aminopeptidase N n=1 Tax=Glaciecola siphonariae TaxID=521012 RepID=A0ABV9LUZ8_9ALTE
MSSILVAKRRDDYRPSDFFIDTVDISFILSPENTEVCNIMEVTRNISGCDILKLDGEQLNFVSLMINGRLAKENIDYTLHENGLDINLDVDHATLEIKNTISPINNTSLEGLYYVSGAYCTQCEAEGFRKITYFLDRPDVLSKYRVTIICDRPELTYLLSNGNKLEDTLLEDGRRKVVWEDPHRKPAYLFALVAGHFDRLEDSFTTSEGREVLLEVFVDSGRLHQAGHAMSSLKKAMKWDEDTFGLAYDLDRYMIVAVDFFNMGAMENKGLNVFNSKFVLAEPKSATDEDYFNIESIIAHEYFHNWTGNRVTCRDWFQLSLKEGLTVFRDQRFSEDMSSALGCRIKQVKVMREHQFAEDAGPMSHPIRPDEVLEMNNFYTVTVYDKGAEVIRMLHTLLTPAGFRRGMDLYFARHDGQAVTCDDFVQAMEDANDANLSQFKLWYSQSGTPEVKLALEQNQLRLTQTNKPTPDQAVKQALYIPIKLSMLDEKGLEHTVDEEHLGTFVLSQEAATISLPERLQHGVPVILTDFSAPVKIDYQYTLDEILHVLRFAQSHYAKWDASQMLYSRLIRLAYDSNEDNDNDNNSDNNNDNNKYNAGQIQSLTNLIEYLEQATLPDDVVAQILCIPSFETLAIEYTQLNPSRLQSAHQELTLLLARTAKDCCERRLKEQRVLPYRYEQSEVNRRTLFAVCIRLHVLALSQEGKGNDLLSAYAQADNMTDKLALLKAAQQADINAFDALMIDFEEEFGHDAVVMDKWFALHATAPRDDILSRLDLLQAHSQYSVKNPNKVRALIGSFAFYNTQGFHAADGSGYKYVVDFLMKLDAINPQVASRIITPLLQMNRYESTYKSLIESQLSRLFTQKNLSKDLFEKLSKTLAQSA